MASIAELYDYADSHGIIIDDTFRLDKVVAMSCPVDDDLCVVGLHRRLRGREYREHLAHEIGHCATGAFYNEDTPVFTRGQCEHRADKWAAHKLIPFRSLVSAMRKGCIEMWQLAEHFDVTEDFIRRTIEIYRQEGKFPAR